MKGISNFFSEMSPRIAPPLIIFAAAVLSAVFSLLPGEGLHANRAAAAGVAAEFWATLLPGSGLFDAVTRVLQGVGGWGAVDAAAVACGVLLLASAALFASRGGWQFHLAAGLLPAVGFTWARDHSTVWTPTLLVSALLILLLAASRTESPLRLLFHILGGLLAGLVAPSGFLWALLYAIAALAVCRTDFRTAPQIGDVIERRPPPLRREKVAPLLRPFVTVVCVSFGWLCSLEILEAPSVLQTLLKGELLQVRLSATGLGALPSIVALMSVAIAAGNYFEKEGRRTRIVALILLPLLATTVPGLPVVVICTIIAAERLARTDPGHWSRNWPPIAVVLLLFGLGLFNRATDGRAREVSEATSRVRVPTQLAVALQGAEVAVGENLLVDAILAGITPDTVITDRELEAAHRLRATENREGMDRLLLRAGPVIKPNALWNDHAKGAWHAVEVGSWGILFARSSKGPSESAPLAMPAAPSDPECATLVRQLLFADLRVEASRALDGTPGRSKSFDLLLVAAEAAELEGSHQRMLENASAALVLKPGDRRAAYFALYGALRAGDKKAAARFADVVAQPGCPPTELLLAAEAARVNNDHATELDLLERLEKEVGQSKLPPQAHLLKAQALELSGRVAEATKALERALASDNLSKAEYAEAVRRLNALQQTPLQPRPDILNN